MKLPALKHIKYTYTPAMFVFLFFKGWGVQGNLPLSYSPALSNLLPNKPHLLRFTSLSAVVRKSVNYTL